MRTGRRSSAEPVIGDDLEPLQKMHSDPPAARDGYDQQTAVGDMSLAIDEARRAAKLVQQTQKATAFDLDAAIARMRLRDSIVDDRAATDAAAPGSGARQRVSTLPTSVAAPVACLPSTSGHPRALPPNRALGVVVPEARLHRARSKEASFVAILLVALAAVLAAITLSH